MIDTTKVYNAVWNVPFKGGLARKRALKKQTQENRISGCSAFNGIWGGDSELEPGYYSCLKLDFFKYKHSKKDPESSLCRYHGTPKAGLDRKCGTADTHEYHLERLVKKCLIERGYPKIIDEDVSRTASCLFHRSNRQVNLSELQFETKLLRLSRCSDFANKIVIGRNR